MRRIVRWVLWSPRHAAVAAAVLAVVVLAATGLFRLVGSRPTATAEQGASCAAAAERFTAVFLDGSLPDGPWRDALGEVVTADAATQLPRIPRANLPAGGPANVDAVAQPGSCDAVVTLDTGEVVTVEVAVESGRWRVSGWGDGP